VERVVREEDASDRRVPFGIAVGTGAVVMVAATAVGAAAFGQGDVAARLVVVAATVGGCAALLGDVQASLITAGLGYLLFDGFLVNRLGELTWDGAASQRRLVVLAVAVGVGRAWRWVRHVRRELVEEESHGG